MSEVRVSRTAAQAFWAFSRLQEPLPPARARQGYVPAAAVGSGGGQCSGGTHLKRSIHRKAAGKPACRVRA